MATPATQWKYLDRKPGSNYRQLFIKGRRISARTLYGSYMSDEEPMTIEQIAANWQVPIEAVREAIAYCESKPPEIEEDFRVEQALMEAHGINHPDYKYDPKKHYRVLAPQEEARIIREIRGE